MSENINEKFLDFSDNGDIKNTQHCLNMGADVDFGYGEALFRASVNDNFEMVKLLVENKANVNARGSVALKWSVEYGKLEIFCYLINHGAILSNAEEGVLNKVLKKDYVNILTYIIVELNLDIDKIKVNTKLKDAKKCYDWLIMYEKNKNLKERLEQNLLSKEEIKKVKI